MQIDLRRVSTVVVFSTNLRNVREVKEDIFCQNEPIQSFLIAPHL